MKNFSRIFMVATAATLMMPASSEACWCNDMWMWCVGMDWKKEPGTINTVEVKQDIRCDSNDNGPCTTPGKEADAPEQECKPSTKVELVLEWKVEGTAHNEIFNVSASAGATLSITIEDSTGKKINQWCECCKRCTFIRKEVRASFITGKACVTVGERRRG